MINNPRNCPRSLTQLTHTTRATAAAAGGHDPDQISYTTTLRALRRAITTGLTPNATQAEALAHLLPARRRRSYPRLTHTSTAKRRAARTTPPGPTTYKTTIITSAHATGLPGP